MTIIIPLTDFTSFYSNLYSTLMRYIKLYVQLSSAPEALNSEIKHHLQEINTTLHDELIKYYDPTHIALNKEDFINLIFFFLRLGILEPPFHKIRGY